jgi:VanZ family protein
MYGIAAGLAAVSYRNAGSSNIVTVSIILGLLGICLESIQWWLPYRSFNPKDILANILGIVAFFILRYICRILVGRIR